jgi:hypothetical protein
MVRAVLFHQRQKCGRWRNRRSIDRPKALATAVPETATTHTLNPSGHSHPPQRSSSLAKKHGSARVSPKLWRGRRALTCSQILGLMSASKKVVIRGSSSRCMWCRLGAISLSCDINMNFDVFWSTVAPKATWLVL